jgi:hypothetical protein
MIATATFANSGFLAALEHGGKTGFADIAARYRYLGWDGNWMAPDDGNSVAAWLVTKTFIVETIIALHQFDLGHPAN